MRPTEDPHNEIARKRRRPRRWVCFVNAFLTAVAFGAVQAGGNFAHAQRRSTEDVEAAYLYNFGKFVRWPDSATHGPMVICIAGEAGLAQTVRSLVAGEQVDGRSLEVRKTTGPDGVTGCSILYLGSSDRAKVEDFLRATAGKPVLTVGAAPDFLDRGGILQFVLVDDHLRFSANLDAADRHGIGLSSELLKVAVSVKSARGNGGAR